MPLDLSNTIKQAKIHIVEVPTERRGNNLVELKKYMKKNKEKPLRLLG